jgi:succinate dehydrogenase/fumarate reductase-like Fe-S protein
VNCANVCAKGLSLAQAIAEIKTMLAERRVRGASSPVR